MKKISSDGAKNKIKQINNQVKRAKRDKIKIATIGYFALITCKKHACYNGYYTKKC